MFDLILIPAYGRTYNTAADAVADWNGGSDFKIANGPYCSVRDIDAMRKQFGTVALLWKKGEPTIVL